MIDARGSGVVDTMVISWLFDERPNPLAERYRGLVGAQPVFIRTVVCHQGACVSAMWSEL